MQNSTFAYFAESTENSFILSHVWVIALFYNKCWIIQYITLQNFIHDGVSTHSQHVRAWRGAAMSCHQWWHVTRRHIRISDRVVSFDFDCLCIWWFEFKSIDVVFKTSSMSIILLLREMYHSMSWAIDLLAKHSLRLRLWDSWWTLLNSLFLHLTVKISS